MSAWCWRGWCGGDEEGGCRGNGGEAGGDDNNGLVVM